MGLLSIDGSDKKPQHLPIGSLKFLGENPYAESMFRVVWSESRYYLVGAEHVEYDESAGGASSDKVLKTRGKDPNQSRIKVGYKWLPLYPNTHAWILECWKSPMAATGCVNAERYAEQFTDPKTGLLMLGPYPSRGEFYMCHSFKETPSYTQVCDTINKVKLGWNFTYNDHLAANKEQTEKKEKNKNRNFMDFFLDAQQAFGNRPTNIRPGKKTKKDVKLKYSAEDLNLQHRSGLSVGSPRS